MKIENLYIITDGRCYTIQVVEKELKGRVSDENWATLLSNIIRPDKAWEIDALMEIDGELYLLLGDELHSPGLILY
jgi:hypothetical protein